MEEKIVLNIHDLDISFKTRKGLIHAIRGVDIRLKKGECVAIVGESGSGKSVTTKSVVGLLSENAIVNRGRVDLLFENDGVEENVNLLEKDIKWIRRNVNGQKVAMVFQDPMSSLDPLMTIGKQIIEAIMWHFDVSLIDAENKAKRLLDEVGIVDVEKCMKQFPHQLSGGMRQRVVIAIALSCDPEILICDEPTTALDVTIQAKILDLIVDLQVKRGLSIVFITHNLGVVAKVADYIYVMYAGQIVEKGSEIDIFYNPKHPYTWGLLSAMPTLDTSDKRLYSIPGTPPNLMYEVKGDAFAPRNKYALEIDFKEAPPMFKISDTHYAATWLLDERAPHVEIPEVVKAIIDRMKEDARKEAEEHE